jgi:uncharacterized membrane protein
MLTWYTLLKFVHVVAVIVWMGGLVALAVVNARIEGDPDHALLRSLSRQNAFLGRAVLGPAALVTLLAGIALAVVLGGGFALWMVWGLVGALASFVLGGTLVRRASLRLVELAGTPSADAARLAAARRRLSRLNLINIALLLSIVWAMVAKPTL